MENDVSSDSLKFKRDWLAYNGGSVDKDPSEYKKPLFFNVAFNYVGVDMDRLRERAGKEPIAAAAKGAGAPATATKHTGKQIEAEEEEKSAEATPPATASTRSGLSSLLGGWWGR
jgi:signal recognition particle subunit SRP68